MEGDKDTLDLEGTEEDEDTKGENLDVDSLLGENIPKKIKKKKKKNLKKEKIWREIKILWIWKMH